MIASLIKFIIRIGFYVVLFFGAVWLFLGIPPNETYVRAHDNINKMLGRASKISKGAQTMVSQMGQEADTQAQHVSDRLQGKDPYERFAGQLDKTVVSGGAQVDLRGH